MAVGLGASVAILFASTTYPTITWWDSSSYSLAAATLGIASPPGSLLLTLIGWPIAKLSAPDQVAHSLNVLAAMISAATVAMVFINAGKTFSLARGDRSNVGVLVGTSAGALLFASTTTLWEYAVRFTPYSLSAFVTTILLFVMLAWWGRADESNAWRLLVLLSFLFGLDFSVHRTNALLVPGALAWVLIRKPAAVLERRTVALSFAALGAGLAIQLLVIPIAAFGGSPHNFSNPNSLSRLWDYVSLKQLGGGFLLGFFPRKSSVLGTQVADVAHVLRDNFFSRSGAFGFLGYTPGIAAIVGAVALVRANARLGVAVLAVLALQIIATILYFNIPDNYFRSFDRHYLPICVTVGVLSACGVAAVCDWAARLASRAMSTAILVLAAIVCVAPLGVNYHRQDASKRYFAHDWATNALAQLPPNAVYVTVGDNDTFPVMFAQSVEGVRRDVTIINRNIAMLPEWRARLRRNDPSFPLSATITEDSIAYAPKFSRPVAYAATGAVYLKWPRDSGRFEGLHWTLAHANERRADLGVVRRNLLEKSIYRGYADPSVDVDETTPSMAVVYLYAATELLDGERQEFGVDRCRADRDTFVRLIPPDRIHLDREVRAKLAKACD
jgi:hypothetical protein